MVFNLTGLSCLINRLFGQFDLLLAGRAALRARQPSAIRPIQQLEARSKEGARSCPAPLERCEVDQLPAALEV